MENCIFCKIIAGEIPSKKLYEDELCLAFYDIAPMAPQHFLVVPKAHIKAANRIDPSNEATVGHIFSTALLPTAARMQDRRWNTCTSMCSVAKSWAHSTKFFAKGGRTPPFDIYILG